MSVTILDGVSWLSLFTFFGICIAVVFMFIMKSKGGK